MLIINADDWGGNWVSTYNSALCFKQNRITSASAMVFMEYSPRAAELALGIGLNTGLHLNFTLEFNGDCVSTKLLERQQRIASFMRRGNYFLLLYNPLLKRDFEYVYNAQYDEYLRLYNNKPTHNDGHHHMHLCTNMLINGLIPKGSKVRRSFTFSAGEKNFFNRFYRCIVDTVLSRRYICTDCFFSISHHKNIESLRKIVNLAKFKNVELGVHPEIQGEFDYLMSDEYLQVIVDAERKSYDYL
jgi:predicted glycoside hydrolase/deacetylase ChbG (UPF0249 family)